MADEPAECAATAAHVDGAARVGAAAQQDGAAHQDALAHVDGAAGVGVAGVGVAVHLDAALVAVEAAVGGGRGLVGSAEDAVVLFERVERLRRLAEVCRVDSIGDVADSRTFYEHGHTSAHVMARKIARTSSGDAARADKIRRMLARCQLIERVWRNGGFSVDQAAVLARAFANPRTRDAFVDTQQWFIGLTEQPFKVFERRVADWARLADQDGPEPKPDPGHQNRDASITQDHFSQQWHQRATFGSLQGANINRIWNAYIEAETLTDYETARKTHNDQVCADLLPRTPAQRRADALEQIFTDAANNPNKSVATETTHNIIWNAETLENMIAKWATNTPTHTKPVTGDDVDNHRCHTLDGHPLNTTTAFADFLTSKFRRIIQNAASITIDISRTQRFFTGLARLGIQLSHHSCYWPGCDIPTTQCQIDHLKPAARGGQTTQTNGAPACQHHNRTKERGYTVTRQPNGTITITTPKGTTIPH